MKTRLVTWGVILVLSCVAEAHEGWGIIVHDRLGVVFSDISGNTVWRVAGGRMTRLLHAHSHQLVLGSDGTIYGTDPQPDGTLASVWRVDTAAMFSYVVPPTSGLPLGLQSFWITRDGTIYSGNRYDHKRPSTVLMRRGPSGNVVVVAGEGRGRADGVGKIAQFSGIDGMSQTADGNLLIADGPYLRAVTPSGSVSTLTPRLTTARWGEDLLGLSSVRDGSVHVADHAGRRILRVRLADGEIQQVDRSEFLWAPAGVQVTDNVLYVLEHLRPPLSILGDLQIAPYLRVRRVDHVGTSTTIAIVWGRHSSKAAIASLACFLFAVWVCNRMRQRYARRY